MCHPVVAIVLSFFHILENVVINVRFNYAHSRTRRIVERTFGLWRRRFHAMHGEMRMTPERVAKIVFATMILHNFAGERHLADFPDVEIDAQLDDADQWLVKIIIGTLLED